MRKKSDTPWTYLTSQHSTWKNWIRTDWKDYNGQETDSSEESPQSSRSSYRVQVSESVNSENDLGDLLEALKPESLPDTSEEIDLTDFERDQILIDTLNEI